MLSRLGTAPLWAGVAAAVVLSLAMVGDRGSSTADVAPTGLLTLAAVLAVIGAVVIAVIVWNAGEWSPAFLALGCIGMGEAAILRGAIAQGWAPGGSDASLEAINAVGMLAGGLWFTIGTRPHWPTGAKNAQQVRLLLVAGSTINAIFVVAAGRFPSAWTETGGMAIVTAAATAGYVIAALSFAAAFRFLRLPSQLSMVLGAASLAAMGIFAVQPFVPLTATPIEILGLAASSLPPAAFIIEQRSRPGLRTMVLSLFLRGAVKHLDRGHPEAVSRLLEQTAAYDGPLGGHLERVATLSVQIGQELGLGPADLRSVAQAARLHDVGKIMVPRHILDFPGRLIGGDWEIMKSHAAAGERIVSRLPVPACAARAVGEHHERWDGSGYPRAIAGADISLAGRIIAVADVFDALCSARAYKAAWSGADALAEVQRGAGTHFDPSVVLALGAVAAGGARLLAA